MFNKDEVAKKWLSCCDRTLPSTQMLLLNAVDPEKADQGIRNNIYQPQVDNMVGEINSNNNANTKKITDKLDDTNTKLDSANTKLDSNNDKLDATNTKLDELKEISSSTGNTDRIIEAINSAADRIVEAINNSNNAGGTE